MLGKIIHHFMKLFHFNDVLKFHILSRAENLKCLVALGFMEARGLNDDVQFAFNVGIALIEEFESLLALFG